MMTKLDEQISAIRFVRLELHEWYDSDDPVEEARLEALLEAIETLEGLRWVEDENKMLHERRGDLCIERDHAREALNQAPPPLNSGKRSGDWFEQARMLVMEYGEWYENARNPAMIYDNRKARMPLPNDS